MISLLNRIAWIISIILGYNLTTIFCSFVFQYGFFSFSFFIVSLIPAIIIKKIFLSEGDIISAVEEFSKKNTSIADVEQNFSPDTSHLSHISVVSTDISEIHTNDQESDFEEHAYSQSPFVEQSLSSDSVPEVVQQEKRYIPEPIVPEEPSALSLWIHNFFSERPLAKVGGILLFLGALFFLWLVFDIVGPVGKVIIGLMFGFFLIGMGIWMDHKKIIVESRVLFGIGIAVNYLTILSGRFLLDGGSIASDPLFSDVSATFFLLLNTSLAVVLALTYRSSILLGFAFVFAYLIPFLIGSRTSSAMLLSIYTTMITLAIGLISFYFDRIQKQETPYLWSIATIGMTFLFALATRENPISLHDLVYDTSGLISIFSGLFIVVAVLSWILFQQKKSPLALYIGAYIVLFCALPVSHGFTLTLSCIFFILVLLSVSFFQGVVTLISLIMFSGASFLFGIFGFWIDGGQSVGLLYVFGVLLFFFLSFLIFQSRSLGLSFVAVGGLGILTLVGFSTMRVSPSLVGMDVALSALIVKGISILILFGSALFTVRLRDASFFLFSLMITGWMLVYPNLTAIYPGYTLVSTLIYLVCSLGVPYFILRDDTPISHRPFLFVGIPFSALVISYVVYQFGELRFPGIGMGLAYMCEALIYLLYALWFGKTTTLFAPEASLRQISQKDTQTLLILFAIPLSLFTFSLAFLFKDVPSMMSLAWVIESAILYLVGTRMKEDRIIHAGHGVLMIGLVKELTLIGDIHKSDWLAFGILAVMLVSVLSSLWVLHGQKSEVRMPYDVFHIFSILLIGVGTGHIIPLTGTGWSIFGPAILLIILSWVYSHVGTKVQSVFLSILLGALCLGFIREFDILKKDIFPLFVQGMSLLLILLVGYLGYIRKTTNGIIDFAISLLGVLILSSLYVDYFLEIFAVSIYLACIATLLIVSGIGRDIPRFRTIGLYIGIFILVKILGYDIWYTSGNLIVRVLALMITGGLMIYLSQLYGRHVVRSWSLELSWSNIVSEASDPIASSATHDSESSTPFSPSDIDPFVGDLHDEMKQVDISGYSGVLFIQDSGERFLIKRVSIIRLARYICNSMGREKFAPNELNGAYNYVLKNMKSALPQEQLQIFLSNLEQWIQIGGSVEFVSKKDEK